MPTTLVFGGTGFLGAQLSAAAVHDSLPLATLAEPHGPPVYAVGREPQSAPCFCTPRDGIRWLTRDLAVDSVITTLLDEIQPDSVFSCAALARLSDCSAHPDLAERLNAQVPRQIALWCAAHGARLLHISTDLVFGSIRPPATGFTETSPPQPLSLYGRTKLSGEQAVLDVHPGALVVRLPLLYGNSGGRGLGASDSLLEAIERGEKPGLFHDEFRTPLEVSNAAQALIELEAGATTGLLHLAGPERISRLEFGLAVLDAMGLEHGDAQDSVHSCSREDQPGHEQRPADASLDSSLARGSLQTPLLDIAGGLAQTMR
jgi:dTDP-4-dehydrorhamnose reductase